MGERHDALASELAKVKAETRAARRSGNVALALQLDDDCARIKRRMKIQIHGKESW